MRDDTVMVLGGDGFCGWPAALRLSKLGYRVIIVDNLSRRRIDMENGCDSLTRIRSMDERVRGWSESGGKKILFKRLDVARNYLGLLDILRKHKPFAVVHYAEQRAAPYSMKSSQNRIYTVDNNINATHNILCAIVETGKDIHLVHLGSTGVYGYVGGDLEIPEGYLTVTPKGSKKKMEILWPVDPGSVYHTTKTMDQLLFYYYNKNDGIKITDLHQGVIWGVNTDETRSNETLVNRLDYCGDYGTVLNRFLIQSVIEHPLTVYGTGGQTRAFINIEDSVECIKLAIQNPPEKVDRVRIINQTTEQLNVLDVAKRVSKLTGAKIKYYNNPRKEPVENDLKMSNDTLIKMGLKPRLLDNDHMSEICGLVHKYQNRIDLPSIICTSVWCDGMKPDYEGSDEPRKILSRNTEKGETL